MSARVSALAIDNLPLLHALAGAAEDATITGIGKGLGRDQSNLSKTLKALREEGTVGEGLALTEQGAAITRILAPDGEVLVPGQVVTRRHDQLQPSPDNDRTHFDEGPESALDGLRISLLEHGQLQNLVITPAGLIISGERRWRAIGIIIDDGDWPAETPITCLVRELSPVDLALTRLTENLQREDIDFLDEGAAFLRLRDTHGLSEQDIADRLGGMSRKHVQDRIRVAQQLPDDLRQRLRLPKDDPDRLKWSEARSAIAAHKPKPDFDVSPAEALVLLELARHIGRNPSRHPMFPAIEGWARLYGAPASGAGLTLARNDVIIIADGPNEGEFYGRIAPSMDVNNWIAARGGGDAETWDAACHHAACDAITPMGATLLLDGKRNATAWLNAPLPPVEPTHADPTPVVAESATALGPDTGAPPSSPSAIIRPSDDNAPPPPPAAGLTPPAEAEADPLCDDAPVTPSPASPPALEAATPPPEPDFPSLSERQLVMLVEIAEQIEADPQKGPQDAYIGARAFEYYKDQEANDLVQKGLIRFNPDARRTGYLVVMTALGEAARAGPASHVPLPPAGAAFWLKPPETAAAPAAGRTISGPLGSMLGDSFQQQIREAAAADEPGSWRMESAASNARTILLTLEQGPLVRLGVHNEIEGKSIVADLTREQAHSLWANLGGALARLDGAA